MTEHNKTLSAVLESRRFLASLSTEKNMSLELTKLISTVTDSQRMG